MDAARPIKTVTLADIAEAQLPVVAKGFGGMEDVQSMTKFSDLTAEQKRMWALDKAIILAMPDHSNDDVIARAEAFLDFITTAGQTPEADEPTPSLQAGAEESQSAVEIAGEQYFPLSSRGPVPWNRPPIAPATNEAPELAAGSLVFSSSEVSVSER